jgi:hypothetical protein
MLRSKVCCYSLVGVGELQVPDDQRVGSSAHPVQGADFVAIQIT